ncbi:MAG TPA: acetyl-CoA carboxylase biotin carboxylase subunit [Modestobacter sp.]|nr:acetyl-CoA carboxylase biotin carboxylase subunit [Modestobacter sp.]
MRRLLIANRGEIAVRVIRAARELDVATVLVVSEADTGSLGAQLADETVVIGPAPAQSSYLSPDAVLRAARSSGADAVHPGYGFLSENADFAERVIGEGLTWVGAAPASIRLMGDKAQARAAAQAAGVPTVPGSGGALPPAGEIPADRLAALAAEVGFPLLVKAAAGGGGRGIRRVDTAEELSAAIAAAQGEALQAFGNADVYVERFIERARHVEVQVLGDGHEVVHLGDRDCTLQRRRQKLVEEAPAPGIPPHVRALLHDSAVALARSTHYVGAGTVEFLYDPAREEVSFIEMNTRLQVEHPVTEFVTGVDLVKEQLRIADGQRLRFGQEEICFRGHSIEVRLNAEDPANGFFPSPGTLEHFDLPGGPGVRVDSGFRAGATVPPFYDSLLAKVVVHAEDRPAAVARALGALAETRIDGVRTNLAFLSDLLRDETFSRHEHHTGHVETLLTGGPR